MLLSLGHVTLLCADFARTEAFYCGLLGLSREGCSADRSPGSF